MCTFKITNFNNELPIDNFLKLGGPTLSNSFSLNGVTFTHHLLSITGEVTPQPIIQNDILYMLLGEVYNYDSVLFKSDIYTVIEQYKLHKDNFTNYLDGEFLIIIYDMRTGLINFYTDPWSTRMAWFDKSANNFYFGSFKLSDSSTRLLHNSHYIFDLKNNSLSQINSSLHIWDLNQYKNSYDDWNIAFEEAVKKRYHKNCVLALSGGLDSSAIAACLTDLKLPFESIILSRKDIEDQYAIKSIRSYISNICTNISIINDKYILNKYSDSFTFLSKIKLGYYSMSYICAKLLYMNKKVLLTGQGADEIIDNYIYKFSSRNKYLNMSYWPENLEEVFPYDHFYEGRQRKLIDMQQYVSLSFGIETRNPFLDKKLTQEWLWLSTSLKNKENKGPIKNFLRKRGIAISRAIAGLGDQTLEKNISLEIIPL
jgi:asparagine synthetase B (glutamine-hydrolysing)